MLLFNRVFPRIDTDALAGLQMMLTISQMFTLFYNALASGVAIGISHFFGQRDYQVFARAAWAGLHLNFIIAILVAIPVYIPRLELGYLFTDSDEVAHLVSMATIPLIVYQFTDGVQVIFSNALPGITYVLPMKLVAFLSYFVASIPLAYLFVITWRGSLVGVWYSLPLRPLHSRCVLLPQADADNNGLKSCLYSSQ